MLAQHASSVLLFAPGAFFFYPWKPVMLYLAGDSYSVGYRHFRRDHSIGINLALHCVSLCWQLVANFGFLNAIDQRLTLTVLARPLSLCTAIMWSVTLIISPAPIMPSIISVLGIAAAFIAAPHVPPHALEYGGMGAFFSAICLATMMQPTPKGAAAFAQFAQRLSHTLKMFALATVMRLAATPWRGEFSGLAMYANVVVGLVVCGLATLPKPTKPLVIAGLLVRAVGEATHQEALLYYGNAFFAQLSQGVSHDVSLQKATLLTHEDSLSENSSREERGEVLAFEWSHCSYFPALLLHSCQQTVAAKRSSARE